MRKATFFWMIVLGLLVVVSAASPSLGAYSAHQNDQDINHFLAVYPFAKSTKLDDCALCHTSGNIAPSSTYLVVAIIATGSISPNPTPETYCRH